MFDEAVGAASARYPRPPGYQPSYGTAGFRDRADLLDRVCFTCGLLVGARALSTGSACGVMITASHNPGGDNGVKLVDPSGEMLDQAWEAHATALAGAPTDDALLGLLHQLFAQHPPQPSHHARVVIGRDTRPSGVGLAAACAAGVQALGLHVSDMGLVTTPELHFGVTVSRRACSCHS
jgi:phosphoacetylglucosamine mutase